MEYELELIFKHIFGMTDTSATDYSYSCMMNNICNQGSEAKTAADNLLNLEVELLEVSFKYFIYVKYLSSLSTRNVHDVSNIFMFFYTTCFFWYNGQ